MKTGGRERGGKGRTTNTFVFDGKVTDSRDSDHAPPKQGHGFRIAGIEPGDENRKDLHGEGKLKAREFRDAPGDVSEYQTDDGHRHVHTLAEPHQLMGLRFRPEVESNHAVDW